MKRMIPLALMLGACSPAPDSAPVDAAFERQTQALDKARAVGNQLDDAAATQREQIDASTEQ